MNKRIYVAKQLSQELLDVDTGWLKMWWLPNVDGSWTPTANLVQVGQGPYDAFENKREKCPKGKKSGVEMSVSPFHGTSSELPRLKSRKPQLFFEFLDTTFRKKIE